MMMMLVQLVAILAAAMSPLSSAFEVSPSAVDQALLHQLKEFMAQQAAVDSVAEQSSGNLRQESSPLASMSEKMILERVFTDDLCTIQSMANFTYFGVNKCMFPMDGSSTYYQYSIDGHDVVQTSFSPSYDSVSQAYDLCGYSYAPYVQPHRYPTSVVRAGTAPRSACVPVVNPMNYMSSSNMAGLYRTLEIVTVSAGSLPSGPQLGTYIYVATSLEACRAFDTRKNIATGAVTAIPHNILGGAPFGVPSYDLAFALSCSENGKSVAFNGWKTSKDPMTGALTASRPTQASVPLNECIPLYPNMNVVHSMEYHYRLVCV